MSDAVLKWSLTEHQVMDIHVPREHRAGYRDVYVFVIHQVAFILTDRGSSLMATSWLALTRLHRCFSTQVGPQTYLLMTTWFLNITSYCTMYIRYYSICMCPLDHWATQFEFSITWSCVSLTRATASSDWKLFVFCQMMSYTSVS